EVAHVEFFADGNSIGESDQFPFTLPWTNAPAGTYLLNATATDEFGAATTSPGITLPLLEMPQLARPALQADGSVRIAFQTTSGQTYTVQYTADLVHWTNAVP